MEYIGAYLRFKREQQHKDAGALCLSCNLTRMQLHSIEQGKSEAHPNTIKRICDYLNIDFIALFQHQEKYRELLEESFIALIYMRKDEQQMLMQKIEALHFEHSILYPQYLLIHLMYVAIHEGAVKKYQSLLKQCSYFIDVLEPRHQFIYYLYSYLITLFEYLSLYSKNLFFHYTLLIALLFSLAKFTPSFLYYI
mgnify:CR=1 FL=1